MNLTPSPTGTREGAALAGKGRCKNQTHLAHTSVHGSQGGTCSCGSRWSLHIHRGHCRIHWYRQLQRSHSLMSMIVTVCITCSFEYNSSSVQRHHQIHRVLKILLKGFQAYLVYICMLMTGNQGYSQHQAWKIHFIINPENCSFIKNRQVTEIYTAWVSYYSAQVQNSIQVQVHTFLSMFKDVKRYFSS